MAAAAAVVASKIRHIIEAFRNARATAVLAAQSLPTLRVEDTWLLQRLMKDGVIREASPGTFYLDEVAWERRQARRRRLAVGLAIALALMGIAVAYFARAS